MREGYAFIDQQKEKLVGIEYNLQLFLYSFSVFLVPFLMGHPQLLVGVIVNACLVLSAVFLDFKGTLPVIILPSLGVLSRGLIFGPFTVYLIYMIPFIWMGNALLVYAMKYLHIKKGMNYFVSLGGASVLKSGFLFGTSFVLVSLGVLPSAFLVAMGSIQLFTAVLGGVGAYGLIKARSLV